jgi:hypothetical protein
MLPSLFHHLHSRAFCSEIKIFEFLHALGSHAVLVMAIKIVDYCFCAEDYCAGEAILACVFPSCDMPPLLLLIAYYPPSSVRSALLCAYALSGLLGLVELDTDTLELPLVLLREFLV